MKCASVTVAPFLLAPLIALTACGSGGGPITLPTYTVSISPQPASIPAGSSVTFTGTTTPAGGEIFWGIVDEGNNVNVGSPTNQIGGNTFTYTAPPTPPIFDTDTVSTVGSVTVRATVLATSTQFNVVVTAPSITTGFSSTLNTVALGQNLVVWAYAVGSVNNAITMQVDGAAGGSATVGTVTPVVNGFYGEYIYTAPATKPMGGGAVTLTVISQADPTKSSNMTVTLM